MVLTLSFSAVSTFLECPYRYYLAYVIKLPGLPKPYFSFGRSLHTALEKLHKPKIVPENPTLEDLMCWFERSWVSEGYTDPEVEAKAKDEGRSILVAYYESVKDNIVRSVDVEKRFKINLGGIDMTGVIDRVDPAPDGALHIIDYKTGNHMPTFLEREEKLQLAIYSMAARSVYRAPVDRASYLYLRTGASLSFSPSDADFENVLETIGDVARRIANEDFPRCENKFCLWCDFYKSCQGAKVINIKDGF